MLILNRSAVAATLTMEEAIDAAAAALLAFSSGNAEAPLRVHLQCPDGVALYMPGLVGEESALGAKIVSVFPGNPKLGLPTIAAALVLQDWATGAPVALMEAGHLTALRTGAAAGVATRVLARADASRVLVFGAGVQARTQLSAVQAVRDVATAMIYDTDGAAAEQMAAEFTAAGLECNAVADANRWVPWADVIIAATTAQKPVFDGSLVSPGTHINGIGSYRPDMQELDAQLIVRADRVVCDTREGAWVETGDLIIPLAQGLITAERVDSEVGDILLGKAPQRTSPEEITVYKGVGLAALDLVAAARIYAQARRRGLGHEIELLS